MKNEEMLDGPEIAKLISREKGKAFIDAMQGLEPKETLFTTASLLSTYLIACTHDEKQALTILDGLVLFMKHQIRTGHEAVANGDIPLVN